MSVTCWRLSYIGDGGDSDGYGPVVKVEGWWCSGCVGNVILVMLNVGCFLGKYSRCGFLKF